MTTHNKMTGQDIHGPISFVFADETARLVTTNPNTGEAYTTDDIGKEAWQTDDDSFYCLTSVTPAWVEKGSSGDIDTLYNSDQTISGVDRRVYWTNGGTYHFHTYDKTTSDWTKSSRVAADSSSGASLNYLTGDGSGSTTTTNSIAVASAMTVTDGENSKGLVYAADYSTNYSTRSLVDKAYVDAQAGTEYTFSNGLTDTSDVITLGGTITDDVSFTPDTTTTYDFSIGSSSIPLATVKNYTTLFYVEAATSTITGSTSAYLTSTGFVQVEGVDKVDLRLDGSSMILIESDQITFNEDIDIESGYGLAFLDSAGNRQVGWGYDELITGEFVFYLNETPTVFSDVTTLANGGVSFRDTAASSADFFTIGSDGISSGVLLEYVADYSTSYTDRSIVDKAYVDSTVAGDTLYTADGALTGDRKVYLATNDLTFYHGSSDTSNALLKVHGDGSHSTYDPYLTFNEGFSTSGGDNSQAVITNFGKANRIQFNDGTASTSTFQIESIVNSSDVFQHMETSFQSLKHEYVNIKKFNWYFHGTSTSDNWSILNSSDVEIFNLNYDASVSFLTPTDSTGSFAVGTSSKAYSTIDLYGDSITATGDLTVDGDVTADNIFSSAPTTMVGTSLGQTVTGTDNPVAFTAITVDGAGSEYDADIAADVITFTEGDGVKIYEISAYIRYTVQDMDDTGSARSYGVLTPRLDMTTLTDYESWAYIREFQGGTNGTGNNGSCMTFQIQPAKSEQLDFLVRAETDTDPITDFEVDGIVVTVKRLT